MNAEFRIDHISLCVRDLARSARFYSETLGLKEIENKTRRPTIRWFSFDGHRAIHLIAGPDEPSPVRLLAAHFCLSTPNFDETLRDLVNKGVTHVNLAGEADTISIRADGVPPTCFT